MDAPDDSDDPAPPTDILREWERLRVYYNGVLIPWTLALGLIDPKRFYGDPAVMIGVGFGGTFANLCFCSGPVVEYYLTWLGLPGRPVRWVAFGLGTLFTALIATAVVGAAVFPFPAPP